MQISNPVSLVHKIFIEFFGEDNVDLQNSTLLIHFPKVTVTNEYDKSVDITHLWVKIKLLENGTIDGTFQMIRSELTFEQFISGYSHSHIHTINHYNYNIWANPCLGTGPIRTTIISLSSEFSEEMWELFCLELSKYVCVESISGTPYVRLENIGTDINKKEIKFPFKCNLEMITPVQSQYINEFILYVIKKQPFSFNFNKSYGIALSDKDIFLTLSDLFIEYYNSIPFDQKDTVESLFRNGIISYGKLIRSKLYYIGYIDSSVDNSTNSLTGRELFPFKGDIVKFNIIQSNQKDNNLSIFLAHEIVSTIIHKILKLVNSKYGQSEN